MVGDSFTKGAPHLPSALWAVPFVGVFPAVIIGFVPPLISGDSKRSSARALGGEDLAASQRLFAALSIALNVLIATIAWGRRRALIERA
jgi:hypothetical protein